MKLNFVGVRNLDSIVFYFVSQTGSHFEFAN